MSKQILYRPGDRVRIRPGRFLPAQMTEQDRGKREARVIDGSDTLGVYGVKFPSYKHTVDYARSELKKIPNVQQKSPPS